MEATTKKPLEMSAEERAAYCAALAAGDKSAWRPEVVRVTVVQKYAPGEEVISRPKQGGGRSRYRYWYIASYRYSGDQGAFRLLRSDGREVSSPAIRTKGGK